MDTSKMPNDRLVARMGELASEHERLKAEIAERLAKVDEVFVEYVEIHKTLTERSLR